MAEVARKDQIDKTDSTDGTGPCCGSPSTHTTDEGSETVFVNGYGIVREDDRMIPHTTDEGGCCVMHAPQLKTYSASVYINGKRAGRKGDIYKDATHTHTISTGSSNVFFGG